MNEAMSSPILGLGVAAAEDGEVPLLDHMHGGIAVGARLEHRHLCPYDSTKEYRHTHCVKTSEKQSAYMHLENPCEDVPSAVYYAASELRRVGDGIETLLAESAFSGSLPEIATREVPELSSIPREPLHRRLRVMVPALACWASTAFGYAPKEYNVKDVPDEVLAYSNKSIGAVDLNSTAAMALHAADMSMQSVNRAHATVDPVETALVTAHSLVKRIEAIELLAYAVRSTEFRRKKLFWWLGLPTLTEIPFLVVPVVKWGLAWSIKISFALLCFLSSYWLYRSIISPHLIVDGLRSKPRLGAII